MNNSKNAFLPILTVLQTSMLSALPLSSLAADTLDPVVITATRTASSADTSLASVSVITRKDIERLQAQSVQELLRNEVGFSVSNNGGAGKLTSTFIRGTESDHVLVLIDGIKVGSATAGTTAFQNLPIDHIERIEIVRGPRSSLYGSGAIGGVIQIFTRKGSKTTRPDFSASAGKYRSQKVNMGVSGGADNAWYNLQFSAFNTDGFNACTGKPFPNGAGCFTVEPDRDAYRTKSASLRAGYRFANNSEIDLSISRSSGDVEFDGDFQNEGDTVQQVIGTSIKFSPTDFWHSNLSFGRSLDESDNFKDGSFSSKFDSERDSLSWQNDFTLPDDDTLTLGLDYEDDTVDSSVNYAVASRNNKAAFAQYQGGFGKHDMILAARHDDNQQFGTHSTGSVSWGYSTNQGIRLTASYGSAFRAPSFNELYFPGFGNANLEPESSDTIELGIRGKADWGHWDVNVFHTKVDELITFDANTFMPVNLNSATIDGLEVRMQTQVADWDLDANLTLLDTENKSTDANHGNELPRRVQQAVNMNLDRSYGKWSAGLSLHWRSSTFDDIGNNRKLKAYTTVDARTAYQFGKDWLVQARIENLFSEDYETASFYNQPKADIWLTLRYQPRSK